MAKRKVNNVKRTKKPTRFDLLNKPTKKQEEEIKNFHTETGNELGLFAFEVYLHDVSMHKLRLKTFIALHKN